MARDAPPEWIPDFPAVRVARLISGAAEAAAEAWAQPLSATEAVTLTAYLQLALVELSGVLSQLAQYRSAAPPGSRLYNPHEPGIYIGSAAKAISCISRDLRDAGSDQPGKRPGHRDSRATTAARSLTDATYVAFTAIGQPSGSVAARDAAVSAFMHALDTIDAAIEALTAHTPSPLPAIFSRQRIRLEHAFISLREALVSSAIGQHEPASLAIAHRLRERHPILPHRSQPARSSSDQATGAYRHREQRAGPGRMRPR
jgi:hypothetical protein